MRTMGLDFTRPAVMATGQLDGTSKRPLETDGHTITTTNGHKRQAQNGDVKAHQVFLFDIEGTTTPISFVKDE